MPQLVNVTPPIAAVQQSSELIKESVVYYTILSGNEDNYFMMQPHTAALHLLRQLDRESIINHHFTLVIQASSSASSMPPSGLSLTQLIVDVVDINDNAPSFDLTRRSISIVENLPTDFNLLKLTATDADQVK